MVKRIVYCETCEANVILRRKQFEHKYHEILCILITFTFGLGYILLKLSKKKNSCPNCQSFFDLDNLPLPRDLNLESTI
ncbi:MAG: hypothetical protein ACFFBP_02250 [Promethearchaeota archaeon]